MDRRLAGHPELAEGSVRALPEAETELILRQAQDDGPKKKVSTEQPLQKDTITPEANPAAAHPGHAHADAARFPRRPGRD